MRVRFCSLGRVERLDANEFFVHVRSLVPIRELRIVFIRMPES